MLFFGLALLIAARPDLDNPGCYRDGWDYFRGICEGISILFFLFKIGDETMEMIRYVALQLHAFLFKIGDEIQEMIRYMWRLHLGAPFIAT